MANFPKQPMLTAVAHCITTVFDTSVKLPPKPPNARYLSLDMWRGVACLMLVFFHATFYVEPVFRLVHPETWSLAGAPLFAIRKFWIGVPIFFVISGYCIAASIDSLRRKDHSLWDYFVRRVRRIYPPLWAAAALTVVFTATVQFFPAVFENVRQLPRLSQFSALAWIGNLTASEAWLGQVARGEPEYLLNNTWTLCYEEQFYLATGCMLAFAARRFFALSAWLTVAVVTVRSIGSRFGYSSQGFFWDGHWLMFAAGILVYHALNYQAGRQRWWTAGIFSAGLIYGAAGRLLGTDPFQKHLSEYVFMACAFGWALIGLKRWDARIAKHRLLLPIAWCGQRSYSIYLTHYPLVVTVSSLLAMAGVTSELGVATITVPICVALSIPFAWLFHVLVERRFMNAPAA